MNELDLSNVINISILTANSGLGIPNINTAALISSEAVPENWDEGQEFAIYTNPDDVKTDFGSSSKAYALSLAFFSQMPNPLQTNGYLAIVPLEEDEDIDEAITRVTESVYFFGVFIDTLLVGDDLAALGSYIQAIDKILFYGSDASADYAPGGMLDLIRSSGKTHTRCMYYKTAVALDTQIMVAAYVGRALSVDFSGVNTTQTLHLKPLTTIVADQTVDQTALTALQAAGVDCYISIAGVASLFTSGTNQFYDQVYNEFWLKFALQVAGFNYLRQTNTKIPQTEFGLDGLKNQYRKVCSQGATNGFIGPGAWNSPTVFGSPEALIRNIKDQGFYVYSQPIADQNQADREDRIAPLIQIAVKAQGAIHKSNVIVNVNL